LIGYIAPSFCRHRIPGSHRKRVQIITGGASGIGAAIAAAHAAKEA
jgi:alkyl hydroperoxide reductase subunit AhpF